jgi:hypothetical protein
MDHDDASEWDACPVVLLYRQSIEIYLKLVAGEGSAFLPSPIDHLTLFKTHSLRWLAQITCQIVKRIGWESTFICEEISSLAEFSSLINELEDLDPVACTVRSANEDRPIGAPPKQLRPISVVPFARDDEQNVPGEFDRIFICRSGGWTPAWVDDSFFGFVEKCPVEPYYTYGELKHRRFDLDRVNTMIAQRTEMIRIFAEKQEVANR